MSGNQPEKLTGLSPEKYGKAAYIDLSFTPSQLNENVLYRDAMKMKTMEDPNQRVRELEAECVQLSDKVSKLERERDGIESSLNQQISMYKKMIEEMEITNANRIKDIHKGFSLEITKMIGSK